MQMYLAMKFAQGLLLYVNVKNKFLLIWHCYSCVLHIDVGVVMCFVYIYFEYVEV